MTDKIMLMRRHAIRVRLRSMQLPLLIRDEQVSASAVLNQSFYKPFYLLTETIQQNTSETDLVSSQLPDWQQILIFVP